ncbi:MAG: response regulator [Methanomassiliicoccales archaeon]|nr:response regulator [Candidatus Methanomethylophilaceae archaeon]MDD7478992.1 response regulator [Methanomassiliicoccales archaeon]MDY4581162.1 response regulator [Candidatus Methanarcanum hacksteinii]
MKALIVDDNIAIQEILSEILVSEGWTTEQTGDVDDAISKLESFRPDLLILDSKVNGLNSFRILDEMEDGNKVRVIIISRSKETIPDDNPNVIGVVTKPFKSSDILSCIRESDLVDSDKNAKGMIHRFFGNNQQSNDAGDAPFEHDVKFGHSYYVIEEEPDMVYELGMSLLKTCRLMIITAGRTKAVNDRFKGYDTKVIGLSTKAKVGYLEMSKLGTLMNMVMSFIEENDRPVVIIDSIVQLIGVNGANTVMTMLHQIISSSKVTLIVSIEENYLSEKDVDVLSSMMEQYVLE